METGDDKCKSADSACDSKTQLLIAYQDATGKYSKAVSDLSKCMGKISKKPNTKSYESVAEQDRRISAGARGDLESHMKEHGC